MKYFLLFFIIITSCEAQNKDIILINNFLDVIKNFDNSKYNELLDYIEVDTTLVQKVEIVFASNFIKTSLNANNYKVMSYEDFKSINKFKEYNCIYPNPNFENVYCVVDGNSFISFIILNDSKNKIISFYSGLIKNVHSIHPIILN